VVYGTDRHRHDPTITINSRWRYRKTPIEVTVTRVILRNVSYIGVHGAISGTVPHWQFLDDFQPPPDKDFQPLQERK
jgi:hypothetical protein